MQHIINVAGFLFGGEDSGGTIDKRTGKERQGHNKKREVGWAKKAVGKAKEVIVKFGGAEWPNSTGLACCHVAARCFLPCSNVSALILTSCLVFLCWCVRLQVSLSHRFCKSMEA